MKKNKEYYKKQLLDIRLKIAFLPLSERQKLNHPYYQELKEVKHEYSKFLFEEIEKENEENDKHKRR